MQVTQIGHRNGDEGVDGDGNKHHPDVFRVVAVAHQISQRMQEHAHDGSEDKRCRGDHAQRGRINALGVLALLAHEAEEGGLHAVGEQDNEQRHVGIDIGDDAILSTGSIEPLRLDGHQKVVDEPRHNAR